MATAYIRLTRTTNVLCAQKAIFFVILNLCIIPRVPYLRRGCVLSLLTVRIHMLPNYLMLLKFSGNLIMPLVFLCCVGGLLTQGRTLKRIAYGDVVESLDDFEAYHYVSIRNRFACISNQVNHDVKGCKEEHVCGGTLFREDFVITAAHCVWWNEFLFLLLSDVYNVSSFDIERFDTEYFGHFSDNVGAQIVVRNAQHAHAFYSNLALLAGSSNALHMEQIRHAFKKFSHPYYGKEFKISSVLEHDVALVQVCEAFHITQNVRLAPMKPLNELTTQYEKVIKKSAVCLYVGFGLDEEKKIHYLTDEGLIVAGTVQMKYTWRQVACSSKCNYNRTLAKIVGFEQPRNPFCGLPVPIPVSNSSDAAPCTVLGITYLHSQQISREDPCDFCLCLDGEVFCWWQQQCLNTTQQQPSPSPQDNSTSGSPESDEWSEESGHNATETPAPQETACRVMGVEYKIGEVLPRETGTCLQCQCSPGARVTCSPKDCTSPDQFHALEQQSLDMFDVDVF